MKIVLAGLVIAAAVTSAASASDRRPARFVQDCSEYGEGFVASPSLGTCLRISGEVRVDAVVGSGRNRLRNRNDVSFDSRVTVGDQPGRLYIRTRSDR